MQRSPRGTAGTLFAVIARAVSVACLVAVVADCIDRGASPGANATPTPATPVSGTSSPNPTGGTAVGFGAFPTVFGHGRVQTGAFDAQSVIDALSAHPSVTVRDVGPASIAGLAGFTIDVWVTDAQPLLDGVRLVE